MKSRRRPSHLSIGSVSSGTLRTVDLLDSVSGALSSLRLSARDRKLVREARAMVDATGTDTGADSDLPDDAADLLSDLMDAAGSYCPDYCHFGSLDGDGAEIGCWPSMDRIGEDRHFGELPDADAVPAGFSGNAVSVNDHGNVTLYRYSHGRRSELWSVV